MYRFIIVPILLLFHSCANGDDPPGHMQPLGSHMPPIDVEIQDNQLDPLEFFEKYAKASKPVLLRGAAKLFPSFNRWKNDEYLKQKYGEWKIQAEIGKKETRKGQIQEMKYEKFLDIYNNSDIYLIEDILPTDPMANDVFIPKCMLCGGYTDAIITSVMWFSSGGTKSVLHNDDLENINCLYDGRKELLLFDKKYDSVPIDMPGSYSSVDVDKVDMYKYPTLANVPWYKATMEAGDCFYIPFKWHHQVNSSHSRNLAINLWWNRLAILPSRDKCPESMSDLPQYLPLSTVQLASEFEQIRSNLFSWFANETATVGYEGYIARMTELVSNITDVKESIDAYFHEVDTDKNNEWSVTEVLAIPGKRLAFLDDVSSEEVEEAYQTQEEESDPKTEFPPGHMKPLGSHTAPQSIEVRRDWPNPVEFFEKYIKPGKPVLFRGVAKQFPSFEDWRNDQYLKSTYGKWKVDVEEGKKENRSQGVLATSLSEFLNNYNRSDIYLVADILPSNPLSDEVYIPKPFLCGGYTDFISTVVLWFSSGGTKSVLHFDTFDNLNCLYDGTKHLVMIDKKHSDLVPIDVINGSYSALDVDSVDMIKYPTVAQLPWYNATMLPGDCLFIPYHWYHQVNSMLSRNLAINLWLFHLYNLPYPESCPEDLSKLPEHSTLKNFEFASFLEYQRSFLFTAFDDGANFTTFDRLETLMSASDEIATSEKTLNEFFDKADSNGDGKLTAAEIYAISYADLGDFFGDVEEAFIEPELEQPNEKEKSLKEEL